MSNNEDSEIYLKPENYGDFEPKKLAIKKNVWKENTYYSILYKGQDFFIETPLFPKIGSGLTSEEFTVNGKTILNDKIKRMKITQTIPSKQVGTEDNFDYTDFENFRDLITKIDTALSKLIKKEYPDDPKTNQASYFWCNSITEGKPTKDDPSKNYDDNLKIRLGLVYNTDKDATPIVTTTVYFYEKENEKPIKYEKYPMDPDWATEHLFKRSYQSKYYIKLDGFTKTIGKIPEFRLKFKACVMKIYKKEFAPKTISLQVDSVDINELSPENIMRSSTVRKNKYIDEDAPKSSKKKNNESRNSPKKKSTTKSNNNLDDDRKSNKNKSKHGKSNKNDSSDESDDENDKKSKKKNKSDSDDEDNTNKSRKNKKINIDEDDENVNKVQKKKNKHVPSDDENDEDDSKSYKKKNKNISSDDENNEDDEKTYKKKKNTEDEYDHSDN